jgi:hypothetical protein
MRQIDEQFFKQITSDEWITTELVKSGFLEKGEVAEIMCQPWERVFETYTSFFYVLEFRYSQDSEGFCPSGCLLKVGKSNLFARNKHEVAFYRAVSRDLPSSYSPRCYGSSIAANLQHTALLLEINDNPLVEFKNQEPGPDHYEQAIKSLALLHARWWNSPYFSRPEFKFAVTFRTDYIAEQLDTEKTDYFFENYGINLTRIQQRIFKELIENYSGLLKQYRESSDVQTLARGDNHFGNYLVPIDKQRTLLHIDWQEWACDFGTFDLTELLGQNGIQWRKKNEKHLLDLYLATLRECNIQYLKKELFIHYRLCLLGTLTQYVFAFFHGKPAPMWVPRMANVFAAIDEYGCADLLS